MTHGCVAGADELIVPMTELPNEREREKHPAVARWDIIGAREDRTPPINFPWPRVNCVESLVNDLRSSGRVA